MSASTISRSGRGNGSGRSNTPSTIEKIAVVAPIPSASISTAVATKPGDFNRWRTAIFRSRYKGHKEPPRECQRYSPQHSHRQSPRMRSGCPFGSYPTSVLYLSQIVRNRLALSKDGQFRAGKIRRSVSSVVKASRQTDRLTSSQVPSESRSPRPQSLHRVDRSRPPCRQQTRDKGEDQNKKG